MPYIKQEDRKVNDPLGVRVTFDNGPAEWQAPIRLASPGELNFAMTILASEYVRRRGMSYTVANEVMGVFASAQAEFYRRVVVPYEDIKRAENGEVYDCLDPLLMHIPEEIDDVEPDKQA